MTSDTRFLRLMDEVERQGGAHLPGLCRQTPITYVKHKEQVPDGEGGYIVQEFSRVESPKLKLCGKEHRFEIPDLVESGENFEPRTTTVCYTDDGMSYWPRFAAIHDVDY